MAVGCWCRADESRVYGVPEQRAVTEGVPLAVCYWLLVSTRWEASVRV
jgi:hypothetical protein